MTTEQNTANLGSMSRQRRRWLIAVSGVLALAAIGYGAYWGLALRYQEFTDDAYVAGNVVQITPQISGTVVAIGADNTQFVQAGQPVVQLDRADAKVALDQAEAQLARTVREVRNLFSTSAQLAATLQVREADLATATEDLARRERLANSGAISGEELQHARDAYRAAQAAVLSARQQLAANRARVDGTSVDNHPDVQNRAGCVSRLCAHQPAGSRIGFRRATQRSAGPASQSGYAAAGDRAARSGLGRRQFQGASARFDAGGPGRQPDCGSVRT